MEWLPYAIGYFHASIHDLTSTFPMALGCSMRIFGQILTVSATSMGPLQEQYWSYSSKSDMKLLPFYVFWRLGAVDCGGGVVFQAPRTNIGFSTTKFPKNGQNHPNGPPQVQYWSNVECPHIESIPFDVCKRNIALSTSYFVPWRSCIRFLTPFLPIFCRNGPKCNPNGPV